MYSRGHLMLRNAIKRTGGARQLSSESGVPLEVINSLMADAPVTQAVVDAIKLPQRPSLVGKPDQVRWPYDDRGRSKITREQIVQESGAALAEARRIFGKMW